MVTACVFVGWVGGWVVCSDDVYCVGATVCVLPCHLCISYHIK